LYLLELELQMRSETGSPKNNVLAERTATRVAAMAVNPYLLHVYWQISDQDLEDIRDALGESLANARPVLRLYDITCILFDGTNAHQVFDVEVDIRTMEWNVPIWSADKSYTIDLGYKAPDGRFYRMARSNVVRVPRAEPSPRVAERSLRVERGEIKSLVPALVAHVPPMKPVEAPRLGAMHGMRRGTGELFKGKAERVKGADWDLTEHGFKEASIIPCHVPKTATTEKQGPVRDTSYSVDLVQLTEERFSFGLSSMPPTQGTNS
jgi:hypothetical protein